MTTVKICPRTGTFCQVTGCLGCGTLPLPTPTAYGWICPRCNVVHGPAVQTCHCHTMFPGPVGQGSGNVGG